MQRSGFFPPVRSTGGLGRIRRILSIGKERLCLSPVILGRDWGIEWWIRDRGEILETPLSVILCRDVGELSVRPLPVALGAEDSGLSSVFAHGFVDCF